MGSTPFRGFQVRAHRLRGNTESIVGTFSGDPTHGQSIHYYPEVRGTKVGIRGPSGGSGIPKTGESTPRGALTYYLANFSRKLHANERIWTEGTRDAPPLPFGSANGTRGYCFQFQRIFQENLSKNIRLYWEAEWHGISTMPLLYLLENLLLSKYVKVKGMLRTIEYQVLQGYCDKDNLLPSREKRSVGTWVLRQ